MSCWRRRKKISWIDRVKNKEVLQTVNDEKNILHQLKKMKGSLDLLHQAEELKEI